MPVLFHIANKNILEIIKRFFFVAPMKIISFVALLLLVWTYLLSFTIVLKNIGENNDPLLDKKMIVPVFCLALHTK